MDDTFQAKLHGIVLEIEDIDDRFETAIARHEFPYRDGALLDNMGQKAREIKFRCWFYNDTYELHKSVIALLDYHGLLELHHPKYGIVQGMVESMSVRHDEKEQTAEIDITFIEDRIAGAEVRDHVEIQSAAEESFLNGQDEQKEAYADDVRAYLGTEAETLLTKELDPLQTVLVQFTGISTRARNYIKQVDAYVAGLEATLGQITNPANSLIATIDYGVDLPGRVIGAIARAGERYAILYESLKTAPCRFLLSLKASLVALEAVYPKFTKQTRAAGAHRCGLEMGVLYKADELVRQRIKRAGRLKSFDCLGNYIGSGPSDPVMTINDIEQSLAETRTYIQSAIDLGRDMQSLKDLARDLLEHVNTIKIEREKIVAVDVDMPLPLHLICLKYGLSYNYAERIHTINRIRHPNFTRGQVNIYVG